MKAVFGGLTEQRLRNTMLCALLMLISILIIVTEDEGGKQLVSSNPTLRLDEVVRLPINHPSFVGEIYASFGSQLIVEIRTGPRSLGLVTYDAPDRIPVLYYVTEKKGYPKIPLYYESIVDMRSRVVQSGLIYGLILLYSVAVIVLYGVVYFREQRVAEALEAT